MKSRIIFRVKKGCLEPLRIFSEPRKGGFFFYAFFTYLPPLWGFFLLPMMMLTSEFFIAIIGVRVGAVRKAPPQTGGIR
ncbi:MAG: hypothetical protein IKD45_01005 [Clostridia bacterium]|nr:hypothetical protein [Clostridia bacterium]